MADPATVTITFDRPHGWTVADFMTVYGIRDQVNFANLVTPTTCPTSIQVSASVVPSCPSAPPATCWCRCLASPWSSTPSGSDYVRIAGGAVLGTAAARRFCCRPSRTETGQPASGVQENWVWRAGVAIQHHLQAIDKAFLPRSVQQLDEMFIAAICVARRRHLTCRPNVVACSSDHSAKLRRIDRHLAAVIAVHRQSCNGN